MGREIRMVPPNWEHPKKTDHHGERYQPMYDQEYKATAKEWLSDAILWSKGEHPAQKGDIWNDYGFFWEYEGTPDEEYCRPYEDKDATWLQVYETVSEGTPVTPPFKTKEELIDYLSTTGDFWDQSRGDGPWNRTNATRFVNSGWAPSGIIDGGVVKGPRDM